MGYRADQINQAIERYPLETDHYRLKVEGNQGDSKWLTITHAELLAVQAILGIKGG